MKSKRRKFNITQAIAGIENSSNSLQSVIARVPRNTRINWILNENRKPSNKEVSETVKS